MWKEEWTLKMVTIFKTFLVEILFYCSWAALSVHKGLNLVWWLTGVLQVVSSCSTLMRFWEGKPPEILVLYLSGAFKKFAVANFLKDLNGSGKSISSGRTKKISSAIKISHWRHSLHSAGGSIMISFSFPGTLEHQVIRGLQAPAGYISMLEWV